MLEWIDILEVPFLRGEGKDVGGLEGEGGTEGGGLWLGYKVNKLIKEKILER